MKKLEILFGLLKIPIDFFAALLGFSIAYQARLNPNLIPGFTFPFDPNELVSLEEFVNFGGYAAVTLIIVFAISGMYTLKNTVKINKEIAKVFLLSLAWLTVIIFYFFVVREFPYSRLALAYSWALSLIFISSGRIILRNIQKQFLKKGYGQRRTLLIGYNKLSEELIESLEKISSYKIVGILGANKSAGDVKVLGEIKDLEKVTKKYRVDEIIQTKSDRKSVV